MEWDYRNIPSFQRLQVHYNMTSIWKRGKSRSDSWIRSQSRPKERHLGTQPKLQWSNLQKIDSKLYLTLIKQVMTHNTIYEISMVSHNSFETRWVMLAQITNSWSLITVSPSNKKATLSKDLSISNKNLEFYVELSMKLNMR